MKKLEILRKINFLSIALLLVSALLCYQCWTVEKEIYKFKKDFVVVFENLELFNKVLSAMIVQEMTETHSKEDLHEL